MMGERGVRRYRLHAGRPFRRRARARRTVARDPAALACGLPSLHRRAGSTALTRGTILAAADECGPPRPFMVHSPGWVLEAETGIHAFGGAPRPSAASRANDEGTVGDKQEQRAGSEDGLLAWQHGVGKGD